VKIALGGTILGRGGIQTHLARLGGLFADAGHDVLVVSLDRPSAATGEPQWPDRVNGLRIRYAYQAGTGVLDPVRGLHAASRTLARFNPDVYIACGTGCNLFLPAILSATKCVKVFHEVMSGESAGLLDTRWLVRLGFDAVVAQASSVRANFHRDFDWRLPIAVLPAFPQSLEEYQEDEIPAAKKVPLGTARAGVFGRLVPHKRVLWLVQQWSALSRYLGELHIFGHGPELTRITAWIAAAHAETTIVCHGAYPAGRAHAELLSEMDMTLLPTVGAEGAPLVLLESMACGVPFVATDAGGIRDYANEDCAIVPAADAAAFVSAVGRMATALDAGALSRQRLLGFYRTNFSGQAISRRWLSWLDSLLVVQS
jgi:glycosyltransferase involved in cell wall biosynthesis